MISWSRLELSQLFRRLVMDIFLRVRGIEEGTEPDAVSKVDRFVEKPRFGTAEEYLSEGGYFWNAGMFVWRPSVILSAIAKHAPVLIGGFRSITGRTWYFDMVLSLAAMEKVYPELEKISVDFAVMEKAEGVVMLESDFDWDDVGEWPAIARHYPADGNGNVFKGRGNCGGFEGKLGFCRTRALYNPPWSGRI